MEKIRIKNKDDKDLERYSHIAWFASLISLCFLIAIIIECVNKFGSEGLGYLISSIFLSAMFSIYLKQLHKATKEQKRRENKK